MEQSQRAPLPDPQAAVITDAKYGRSADAAMRERRYLITMGIRVVCIGLAFVAPGVLRWICFGLAAFLPAAAVLLGNAVDKRTPPEPAEADLTRPAILPGEVIPGEVSETEPVSRRSPT